MKTASCLLALLAAAAPAATPPNEPPQPDFRHASVTLPYTELRGLWEAGLGKPVEPPDAAPVPFVVHRAEIRISLGEAASKIDARFEVETMEQQWQRIPLLGGEVQLDKVDAGERSVVWDDGYALLTNAIGRTAVALNLATRGVADFALPLKLTIGNASVKRLTVTGIPIGLEARVNGEAGESIDGASVFLLPGGASEFSLALATPKVEKAPRPSEPITPSRWKTQSQVLVRHSEGRLRFLTRVFASTDDGSGLDITLALPASAGSIVVTSEDLADWSQTRSHDGRLLSILWKTRDVLDRELTLSYTVPQSTLAEQWNLQAPSSPDDGDSHHLFAILPADGLELKGVALRAAVDSRRLPEWMRAEIGGAAFVTAETGTHLVLQTHWLPAIATASAIVSESKASLRLVADGSTQTAVAYTIKHQAPLAWRLELPKNTELLSCIVAGAAAQPIQRENGVIELALATPGKGATTVALVYTAKLAPLDPVSGEVTLELPLTPLFIEHLDWSIALPDIFEITAIDGNVSVAEGIVEPTRGDRAIALRRDFCRAERPAVSLFFQRRSLDK